VVRDFDLDFSLLEEVSIFAVGEDGMPALSDIAAKQFCLSIEEPSLTLLDVMNGMLASDDCQTVTTVRKRYAEKVFAVLRLVAKALRHLHSLSLVHGSVCAANCAKYGSRWKLRNVLGIERSQVESSTKSVGSETNDNTELMPGPAADVWDFGMLAFEILVGERLFFDDEMPRIDIVDWERRKGIARERLVEASVSPSGAALILSCLHPNRTSRPTMADLLRKAFWKEFKRQNDAN
jgi:Protein tyrosine and serine/threonine kinase